MKRQEQMRPAAVVLRTTDTRRLPVTFKEWAHPAGLAHSLIIMTDRTGFWTRKSRSVQFAKVMHSDRFIHRASWLGNLKIFG